MPGMNIGSRDDHVDAEQPRLMVVKLLDAYKQLDDEAVNSERSGRGDGGPTVASISSCHVKAVLRRRGVFTRTG